MAFFWCGTRISLVTSKKMYGRIHVLLHRSGLSIIICLSFFLTVITTFGQLELIIFWQSTKVEDLVNTSNDSIFGRWFALSSLSRGTIWRRRRRHGQCRHANVNSIVEYHFLLPCRSPPLGQIVSSHRLTMCHRHPKPMTIAALGVESHIISATIIPPCVWS